MKPCIVLFVLFLLAPPPVFAQASGPEPTPDCDINNDGRVDHEDILLLQLSWRTAFVTPTATPEPEITVLLPDLPGGAEALTLVLIPSGTFSMGSSEGPDWSWCHPCEQPVHEVTFDRDFYMARYETTLGQYVAFLRDTGDESDVNWEDANCPLTRTAGTYALSGNAMGQTWDQPMVDVSWNGVDSFAEWVSNQAGLSARLPSEAEWEYACRAGTTTRFYFGDSNCADAGCDSCDLDDYAWWCANNDPDGTKDVGLKTPNAFGLYDMMGNVWEWCQDGWHEDYTGAPADGSAWVADGSVLRVQRGGYFDTVHPQSFRSSSRNWATADLAIYKAGFRLVIETPSFVPRGAPDLSGPEPSTDLDINHDGSVDESDLMLMLDDWHHAYPTPTPTASMTPTPTRTPTPTPTPLPSQILINLPNLPAGAKTLVLLLISPGVFQMGSNDSWSTGLEQPAHSVTLTKPFYLGKFEVTQAQWKAVTGSTLFWEYGSGNDYPVYGVSWNTITKQDGFLDRLNALGQGTFRLPTEAEWEYACRSGSTTRFSFGDSNCVDGICSTCNLSQHDWWCGNNGPMGWPDYGAKEVGQLLPNPFGLYDMHGNVREWCADWYGVYTSEPATDPTGPTSGWYRIIRGGDWGSNPGPCRSAARDRILPDNSGGPGQSFGFRVLRETP